MIEHSEKNPSDLIMERLRQKADLMSRPQSRHATLDRLEEACDAIVSGEAAKSAERAGLDALPFKIRPPKLNSESVARYVRVRRRLDGDHVWTGPTASFIRSDPGLKEYLTAREIEACGGRAKAKRRISKRSIDEILSGIADPNDRLAAFDDRARLQHEIEGLRIAVKAIEDFSGLDIDQLISAKTDGRIHLAEVSTPLPDRDRLTISRLVNRLSNTSELAPFGLMTDGQRVRMSFGPKTVLIKKEELEVLRQQAGEYVMPMGESKRDD